MKDLPKLCEREMDNESLGWWVGMLTWYSKNLLRVEYAAADIYMEYSKVDGTGQSSRKRTVLHAPVVMILCSLCKRARSR